MCGGTAAQIIDGLYTKGLSPRVRGNHSSWDIFSVSGGSIPACAGEPPPVPPMLALTQVYPRVCGGTDGTVQGLQPLDGLSPRVRGNPTKSPVIVTSPRSIPACAGEPQIVVPHLVAVQVYPRVCGGTPRSLKASQTASGLSPRVRGNPSRQASTSRSWRSIPACAGEPTRAVTPSGMRTVYPRVCGGTPGRANRPGSTIGLSPRVRGNPCGMECLTKVRRSIPACAGEPDGRNGTNGRDGVYPRVCGGTDWG